MRNTICTTTYELQDVNHNTCFSKSNFIRSDCRSSPVIVVISSYVKRRMAHRSSYKMRLTSHVTRTPDVSLLTADHVAVTAKMVSMGMALPNAKV